MSAADPFNKPGESQRIDSQDLAPGTSFGGNSWPELDARITELEVLVARDEETIKQMISAPASEDYDELILLRDIPLVSVCEHHLVPFIGRAHVAYLPTPGRVTGLSKLARIVNMEARKLQVQERMTAAIADDIMGTLAPRGVMVVIEAEHLCMTIRGAHKPGAVTVTSVVRGLFRENEATRTEALALLRNGRGSA